MAYQRRTKKDFLVPYSMRRQFPHLSIEERGILFTALFDFEIDGKRYDGDNIRLSIILDDAYGYLEEKKIAYKERAEQNRKNAQRNSGNNESLIPSDSSNQST